MLILRPTGRFLERPVLPENSVEVVPDGQWTQGGAKNDATEADLIGPVDPDRGRRLMPPPDARVQSAEVKA